MTAPKSAAMKVFILLAVVYAAGFLTAWALDHVTLGVR